MEVIKKTDKYMIVKKRSGRFGVRSMNRSWINGPEKARILAEAGLIDQVPTQNNATSDSNAKSAKIKTETEDDDSSEEAEQDSVSV